MLVDGEAYFSAVADAIERAERSLWLIGWEFHSEVRLRRDAPSATPSATAASSRGSELIALLEARVRVCPALRVRVLAWDFYSVYALEREPWPTLSFGVETHPRIEFALDSAHPIGASHHQKLVVVDDALAFVGGLDLTEHRWDTREHRADEPRRRTLSGLRYDPFHDVQLAVDGPIAGLVADLAKGRWRRATGWRIDRTPEGADPWPAALGAPLRDATVAIARTQPCHAGAPEVREIEALYRESIAAAERSIYIENQYLTSRRIGAWLAERLREPDGPEIVIVGPRRQSGWLEDNTMGALRDRLVRKLRAADAHDHLRVLYPDAPGLEPTRMISVHAKLMITDDDLLHIGSANLSNRSMGLDTECNLVLDAAGDAHLERAIAATRSDLLAEHLGTRPECVARAVRRTGSLVRAVDELCATGGRTLRRLESAASDGRAQAVERIGAIDPEHPVPLEEIVERIATPPADDRAAAADSPRASRISSRWLLFGEIALLVGLAVIWRRSLAEMLPPERMTLLLEPLRANALGPLVATAGFTLASLLMVPVTALAVATGAALGPVVGIPVTWIGSVLAAAIGHAAGAAAWREPAGRLTGRRFRALNARLARRGVLSSAVLRLVPVAPFMIVNLAAGASRVRMRDFVVGTALGMLPGTVVLVLVGDHASAWLPESTLGVATLGLASLAIIGATGVAFGVRRLFTGPGSPPERDAREPDQGTNPRSAATDL